MQQVKHEQKDNWVHGPYTGPYCWDTFRQIRHTDRQTHTPTDRQTDRQQGLPGRPGEGVEWGEVTLTHCAQCENSPYESPTLVLDWLHSERADNTKPAITTAQTPEELNQNFPEPSTHTHTLHNTQALSRLSLCYRDDCSVRECEQA